MSRSSTSRHKLDELLSIGDRITVLRDGRIVASAEAADVDVAWIIEQMVGPLSRHRSSAATEHEQGEPLLRVEDVTLPRLGGGFLLDHVSAARSTPARSWASTDSWAPAAPS